MLEDNNGVQDDAEANIAQPLRPHSHLHQTTNCGTRAEWQDHLVASAQCQHNVTIFKSLAIDLVRMMRTGKLSNMDITSSSKRGSLFDVIWQTLQCGHHKRIKRSWLHLSRLEFAKIPIRSQVCELGNFIRSLLTDMNICAANVTRVNIGDVRKCA